jgi:uncharacterized membrane protein HdeD (DUF308 family)
MYIGLGIALLVIGLILVTGVLNFNIGAIDENTLGWILIIAGVLAIVLSLVLASQRRRSTVVTQERRTPPPGY